MIQTLYRLLQTHMSSALRLTPDTVSLTDAFGTNPIGAHILFICAICVFNKYRTFFICESVRHICQEYIVQRYSPPTPTPASADAHTTFVAAGQIRFGVFLVGVFLHPHQLYTVCLTLCKQNTPWASIWTGVCVDWIVVCLLLILHIKMMSSIPHIAEEKAQYEVCLKSTQLSGYTYSITQHCLFKDKDRFGHIVLDFLNVSLCILFIAKHLIRYSLHTLYSVFCAASQFVSPGCQDISSYVSSTMEELTHTMRECVGCTTYPEYAEDTVRHTEESTITWDESEYDEEDWSEYDEEDWSEYDEEELCNKLVAIGLNKRGNKVDLIARLIAHYATQ